MYETKYGDCFWLNNEGYLDKCIKQTGVFDPQSTNVVKNLVKKGDVVLDVGANIGYYSVLMSKLVGINERVISFELTQHYREVLQSNIEINNLNNCDIMDFGLSNGNDICEISIGSSSATMHWADDSKPIKTEKIQLKRLDDIIEFQNINKIDFIKIDVDGHEPVFLEGAWQSIEKFKPVILLEVNHANYLNYGITAWEFYDLLKRHEFFIYSEQNLAEIETKNQFLFLCGNFAYSANIIISKGKINI
ncbi:FkbM family methyltransferase [Anaerosinus massiliensis]|uniref:FkbM family methyltransferase n=1 Tax=Massilibacillus massiliensis TaxID=1806837 RepID=UPI0018FE489F|nr:FkbM family methyltransferase [Massilibacillus massiliensis]